MGVACFLANDKQGYLYSVHHKPRLISSFSFMTGSKKAVCGPSVLHVLSADSVESYTSRAFQAALSDGAVVGSCMPERVRDEEVREGEGGEEADGGSYEWKEWLKQVSLRHTVATLMKLLTV